ncbi:inositol polyphosphate multikinase-like [Oratosquilla oratoria]|uniref:inositol polyphosphate multikinase-like n=1 Tax=Oratosquilla oratoria TaxID=337810 RepID=UPI003F75DAC4
MEAKVLEPLEDKMRKSSHLLSEALDHVREMEYQMGGQHKNPNLVMMRSECGHYVFKPVKEAVNYKTIPNYKQAAVDELSFYEMVFGNLVLPSAQADLKFLRPLMPSFLGHTTVNKNGQGMRCIILKDETWGLTAPCLLDLKMGRRHYFEGDTAVERSKAKYLSKDDLGFCIAGMQICDPGSGHVTTSIRPQTGTHLDSSQVLQYMDKFLQKGHPKSSLLRKQILEKVLDILKWFQSQKSFLFLRSSLFVAYDALQFMKSPEVIIGETTGNTNEGKLHDEEQGNDVPVVSNTHCETSTWADAHKKPHRTSSSVESVNQKDQPNTNSPDVLNSHCQVPPTCSQVTSNLHLHMNQEKGSGNGPTKEADTHSTPASCQQPNAVCWPCPQEYQSEKLAAAVPGELAMEVRLRMIDFAHVYHSRGVPDENYLFGLNHLIAYLNKE